MLMQKIGQMSIVFLLLILLSYTLLIVIAREQFTNELFYFLLALGVISISLMAGGLKSAFKTKTASEKKYITSAVIRPKMVFDQGVLP